MQTSQQILVGIIALVILIVLIVYTEYYSRRKFTKDKGEKFDEDLSPSYGSTSVDIEFKDKKVIHRHEEKVDEGQDEIELCNNETGFYAGSILYKTDVDLVRYNIKFVFSESGIVYRSIVEEYNYNASNLLIEMIAVSETINIPALALNKINDINYGTVEKIDQNCYYIKINVDKTVSGIQSTQRYQSVLIEKGRLIVSDIPEDSLNYPKPRHLNSFVFNYYCDFREFQVVNNQLQEFREILDALFKKEIQEYIEKFKNEDVKLLNVRIISFGNILCDHFKGTYGVYSSATALYFCEEDFKQMIDQVWTKCLFDIMTQRGNISYNV